MYKPFLNSIDAALEALTSHQVGALQLLSGSIRVCHA